MSVELGLSLAGLLLGTLSFWFSRQDRGVEARRKEGELMWSKIDDVRSALELHKVEDARLYITKDDLRGLHGRLDAIIDRIDRLFGRNS